MNSKEKSKKDIEVDPDQLEHYYEEICCEEELKENREAYCRDLACQMRSAIKDNNYWLAYNKVTQLKELDEVAYQEEIECCYKNCAEHGVLNALIYEAAQNVIKVKPIEYEYIVKPEAFLYLKSLSDMGYIKSFRWLADCYSGGIGCEWDSKKTQHLYFEGMLFDDDAYCRERYAESNVELEDYDGDNPVKNAVKMMAFSKNSDKRSYARINLAEMIMNGRIEEYQPDSAYVILLKEQCNTGIAEYHLGECVLYGIGTKPEPIAANKILTEAYREIEVILKTYSEDWAKAHKYGYYHTKEEYLSAYERTKVLLEEAKEAKLKIMMRDNVDMNPIYDDWKTKTPVFIKRSYKV